MRFWGILRDGDVHSNNINSVHVGVGGLYLKVQYEKQRDSALRFIMSWESGGSCIHIVITLSHNATPSCGFVYHSNAHTRSGVAALENVSSRTK